MGSLQTFEMNLEEEKCDKKAKRVVFQEESHTEEMKSAYDDDDDDFTEAVVKIIKRLNDSCPRRRNSNSVSLDVPMARRNTPL